jgi:hypothetical protein
MEKPRTPDEIRDAAIAHFIERAVPKFNKGQKEHGGSCDQRANFEELENEIIDLWFYMMSMKHKLKLQPKGMNCWHCNAELIWGGDLDCDDCDDGPAIMTNLSCPKCPATFDVYLPLEDD